MSFIEIPRGVLKKLNTSDLDFFWQYDQEKKKYKLVKWPILREPKDQGGMGIMNLELQNRCVLSKWLFSYVMKKACGRI